MLTEIYVEALLVNEKLADEVWELWASAQYSDDQATQAWLEIVSIARIPRG